MNLHVPVCVSLCKTHALVMVGGGGHVASSEHCEPDGVDVCHRVDPVLRVHCSAAAGPGGDDAGCWLIGGIGKGAGLSQ
jgi:hypothetical protein